MKKETEELLKEAEDICDREDRSVEYMIQFMQDYAKCSHETVMKYIEKTWSKK